MATMRTRVRQRRVRLEIECLEGRLLLSHAPALPTMPAAPPPEHQGAMPARHDGAVSMGESHAEDAPPASFQGDHAQPRTDAGSERPLFATPAAAGHDEDHAAALDRQEEEKLAANTTNLRTAAASAASTASTASTASVANTVEELAATTTRTVRGTVAAKREANATGADTAVSVPEEGASVGTFAVVAVPTPAAPLHDAESALARLSAEPTVSATGERVVLAATVLPFVGRSTAEGVAPALSARMPPLDVPLVSGRGDAPALLPAAPVLATVPPAEEPDAPALPRPAIPDAPPRLDPQLADLLTNRLPLGLGALEQALRTFTRPTTTAETREPLLLQWVGLASWLAASALAYALARQHFALAVPLLVNPRFGRARDEETKEPA